MSVVFVGEARRSGDVRMLHPLGFQVFSETGTRVCAAGPIVIFDQLEIYFVSSVQS